MAVEARHLNLFPSQLLGNRQMMNPVQGTPGLYNTHMGSIHGVPSSETNALLPMYGCSVFADTIRPKRTAEPDLRSDSVVTDYLPAASRKRSRIETSMINSSSQTQKIPNLPFFLGEDLSVQIQKHQFDIDRLVSQHIEKVRIEIELKRKREAMRIVEAIEGRMVNKLREKEQEIEKMGKINWVLEEKVKSLCVENQIWRQLAQANEATANALRTNLEQVLARHVASAADDDGASCCGSSGEGENGNNSMCRSCGKEEACVLLLPCRHLCLCATCGSTLHTCPVCKGTKNASVHVNMS